MNDHRRTAAAVAGGMLVTICIFLFLLAGTASRSTPAREPLYGAVRISTVLQDRAHDVEKPLATAEAPPAVRPLEPLVAIRTPTLQMPRLDFQPAPPSLAATPSLAVSLPSAGLPALPPVAPAVASSGGALTLGEVDEGPRPLFAPAPRYPLRDGVVAGQTRVLVRVTIGADGEVTDARPLDVNDELKPFADAAVAAVLRWRFVPCKKNGQAVACMADQPFTFSRSR